MQIFHLCAGGNCSKNRQIGNLIWWFQSFPNTWNALIVVPSVAGKKWLRNRKIARPCGCLSWFPRRVSPSKRLCNERCSASSYWLTQGFDPCGFVQKQNRAPAHDFMALGAFIECQGQRTSPLIPCAAKFRAPCHTNKDWHADFQHCSAILLWNMVRCGQPWSMAAIQLQRMIKIGRDFQSLYAPSPMFEVPTMS